MAFPPARRSICQPAERQPGQASSRTNGQASEAIARRDGVARDGPACRSARHAASSERTSSSGRAGNFQYAEQSALRASSRWFTSSRRKVTWSPNAWADRRMVLISRSVSGPAHRTATACGARWPTARAGCRPSARPKAPPSAPADSCTRRHARSGSAARRDPARRVAMASERARLRVNEERSWTTSDVDWRTMRQLLARASARGPRCDEAHGVCPAQ